MKNLIIAFLILAGFIMLKDTKGDSPSGFRAYIPAPTPTYNPPHYNINNFTDSSQWYTSMGATISGGKVTLSGGDGTGFQKYMSFMDTICSNHWRIAARLKMITTKAGDTYGASVGIRSVNTASRFGYAIFPNTSNGGTSGQYEWFRQANSGSWGAILSNTNTVTNSTNDKLVVVMERNNNYLYVRLYNETTKTTSSESTIPGYTINISDANVCPPNTGVPTIWMNGITGSVEVDSFFFQDLEPINIDIAYIGDSKTYGLGASNFTETWPSLLSKVFPSYSIYAGVGDRTIDVKARLWQVVTAKPKIAICAFGSNDIRYSVSQATREANIKYIDSVLMRQGIYTLWCLPFKETGVDQSTISTLLRTDSQFSGRTIDTESATEEASLLTGDGIHLNAKGNRMIADRVKVAIQLTGKVRVQNPNQ